MKYVDVLEVLSVVSSHSGCVNCGQCRAGQFANTSASINCTNCSAGQLHHSCRLLAHLGACRFSRFYCVKYPQIYGSFSVSWLSIRVNLCNCVIMFFLIHTSSTKDKPLLKVLFVDIIRLLSMCY